MRLLATCARGLEDVSAAEVAELTGACAEPGVGHVTFAATWPQVGDLQVRARTLHGVHRLLGRFEAKDLADAEAAARTLDWAPLVPPGASFAVEAERAGSQPFTSLDLGRVVGSAVVEGVRAARGERLRVDLERPDVAVAALLRGSELLLGLDLTGAPLHQRAYRVHDHPAPLRPSLAAALLRWGGWDPAQALWDPMCGSGTLPIEAAMAARALPPGAARGFRMERVEGFPAEALAGARARALAEARPEAMPRIAGTERYERHLLGAAQQARAAGVWDALTLRVLDATRALPADLPFAPELVVVNPPYGLRIASRRVVGKLYRDFLLALRRMGPRRLVVLVGNAWFEEAAAAQGLLPAEARPVTYGQLATRALRFDLA